MINFKNISNKIFYWVILVFVITPTYLSAQHFEVDLEVTGNSQLTILSDSITMIVSLLMISIFKKSFNRFSKGFNS